ncbi:MAG: uroporphyrinogen decarboxylase family protein [Planctomycetota bacterium]
MTHKAEMTTRERFHAVMKFQPFDRLPMIEWATWWDKTIERWHTEGLPAAVKDRYDLYTHFGLEQYKQKWVGVTGPNCPQPAHHGAGVISSMDDYEKILPHLYPKPAIDPVKWQPWAQEQKRGDTVIWFTVDGFFWFPRNLMGIEPHLYAFYDQPELMHRINTDLANWIIHVIDEIHAICTPDFMTFGEDMSYNHGPMMSKELFDTFLKPYYHKVLPRIKERGTLAIIDSDGDVTVPAYWFEEAGLDGILPLERQAGVDIARLRKEHPRMRFIGHFDKMTMNKGEAAMRAEFERLLPTAAKGGFIISVDHQTPPGVSLENYRIYLNLFREYAERAGKNGFDKV